MRKLLVVSGRDMDPAGYEVERVKRLSAAAELLSSGTFDAFVIDYRHVRPNADIDFVGDVPRVAIVPDGQGPLTARLSDAGFAIVPDRWLEDVAILRHPIERQIERQARDRELESFQKRQRQLIHAEKFAAVGLLAAEIAHEINNPATFVITNLTVMIEYVETLARFHEAVREELAGDGLSPASYEALEVEHEIGFLSEDLETLLARSLAGLNRIHQIVQDLRFFAHDRAAESGPVDLEGLVVAAMNLVRHEARYHTTVDVDLGSVPQVRSDASRISQAILNVLVNAVQSIPAGDPDNNLVRVRADVTDDYVDIVVEDTGVGIEEERLAKIFEPFFTTKEPGQGTGLGLAISRDIMLSLGGDILAESTPGVGSAFTIRVPREAS